MTALLEYSDLLLTEIGQDKTNLQKGFPETSGNPPWYAPASHTVK